MPDSVHQLLIEVRADQRAARRDLDSLGAAVRRTGDEARRANRGQAELGAAVRRAGDEARRANRGQAELAAAIERSGRAAADSSSRQERLARSTVRAADSAERASSVFGKLRGVLLGAGLAQAARSAIQTSAAFEQLRLRLKVFEGDAAAASRRFDELLQYAATTPFALRDVVDSFLQLEATNFEPDLDALRSLGDIAAASGRSLRDLATAVSAVGRGEFEPIEGFGFEARKQGEEVRIAFRDIVRVVRGGRAEILRAFADIGNARFGGATEELANSLTGALSNLGDSVEQLSDAFGRGGFAQAVTDASRELSSMAGSAHALGGALGGATGFLLRHADVLGTVAGAYGLVRLNAAAMGAVQGRMARGLSFSTRRMIAMARAGRVAAASMHGLRRAMTALGGPLGAALLVAEGLAYLALRSGSAADEVDGLAARTNSYTNALREQSRAQEAAARADDERARSVDRLEGRIRLLREGEGFSLIGGISRRAQLRREDLGELEADGGYGELKEAVRRRRELFALHAARLDEARDEYLDALRGGSREEIEAASNAVEGAGAAFDANAARWRNNIDAMGQIDADAVRRLVERLRREHRDLVEARAEFDAEFGRQVLKGLGERGGSAGGTPVPGANAGAAAYIENLERQLEARRSLTQAARAEADLRSGRIKATDEEAGRIRALAAALDDEKKAREDAAKAAQDAAETDKRHASAVAGIEAVRRGLLSSYDQERAAIEDWRRETRAALDETRAGHEARLAAIEEVSAAQLRAIDEREAAEGSALDDWRGGLRGWVDAARDASAGMEDVLVGGIDRMSSALADFARTGKLEFGALVDSIIADVVRMLANRAIAQFLAGFIGTGTGAAGSTVNTFVPDPGPALVAHGGGVAGSLGGVSRLGVAARAFADAPRLHGGGVAGIRPGEVPAILRRGEGVFTPEQMASLSPQSAPMEITVRVENRGDAPIAALDGSAEFDGGRLVISAVVDDLAGGGQVSRTLERTFGLRRRGL